MSGQTVGSAASQDILWSARAEDWAAVQEGQFRPLYEVGLDRAAVGQGTVLLDAGCGAGLACSLAAERGASVWGLDAAQGMLEIAARRLPQAHFRVGDLEQLPFPDATFDVVTGFQSFEFAESSVNAVKEARRVVRPGGAVLIATWGRQEACQTAAYIVAVAGLLPPLLPGARGPFSLSEPGALQALAAEAGLIPLSVEAVACPWHYPDLATLLRGVLASGDHARAIATLGEEPVREAIADAVAPFARADGSYRMENEFQFVLARAPGASTPREA